MTHWDKIRDIEQQLARVPELETELRKQQATRRGIKPCPFPIVHVLCSHSRKDIEVITTFDGALKELCTMRVFVRCNECKAQGPQTNTEPSAIKAWNAIEAGFVPAEEKK